MSSGSSRAHRFTRYWAGLLVTGHAPWRGLMAIRTMPSWRPSARRAGPVIAHSCSGPHDHSRNHSATLVNATRQRLDRVAPRRVQRFCGRCRGWANSWRCIQPGCGARAITSALVRRAMPALEPECRAQNRGRERNTGRIRTLRCRGRRISGPAAQRCSGRGPSRPRPPDHPARRVAAVAEPYYVPIAPYHDGGPIATAAALHLAASLPNFFIQQVPYPGAGEDRRMRTRLTGAPVETVQDGFLQLTTGPGLGISVNEAGTRRVQGA